MLIREWCDYIKEWRHSKQFETGWDNTMEKIALFAEEIGELVSAYRHLKFNKDIVCPTCGHPGDILDVEKDEHYANFREELADLTIRVFDLAGSLNIDLEKEIEKKMKINETRPVKHGKNC